MSSLPTAQERRIKSHSHESEMVEKYSTIRGYDKALDFHYWWQEVKYESEGKVTFGYHRDFPLPHGNYYLQHFIETYFSQGSENNLIFNLENHFIGDEIDAEYIETLFISIKDLGLFTPKSILIFNDGAGSMTTYAPPADGLEYVNVASTHNVSSSSVFEGSEINLERAGIIRRWLSRRAKELTKNNYFRNTYGTTLSPDTKQLGPSLIERDGRFFVLVLEGELETSIEEIKRRREIANHLESFSQTWTRLYGHQKWSISNTPRDAEVYVNVSLFFDSVKQFFQDNYDKGESLWTSYAMCEMCIDMAKRDLENPYNNQLFNKSLLAGWIGAKKFLNLLPKRGVFDETPPFANSNTVTGTDSITPTSIESDHSLHPWERIDAIAHNIGLLKAGQFTPPSNRIAAAVAGFIDALRLKGLLPATATLPNLYEDFTQYYGRKITADRDTATRQDWRQKTQRALGVE